MRRALRGLVILLAAGAVACNGTQPLGGDDPGSGGEAGIGGKADGYGEWSGSRSMNAWNDSENQRFSEWIAKLGTARAAGKCLSLASCISSSSANSLWTGEDSGFEVFADCADLPYVLRAYYSYKRRLPFSFVSAISGGQYTSGNLPESHSSWLDYENLPDLLRAIVNQVHSGFYRTAPEVEDNDFYPVAITRQTVKPGTVYYDPNGHVLLVYAVEDDGTVRMIDGHPDNSLTVQRFGEEFARGNAGQGGGFRAWRHQSYSSGQVVRASNSDGQRNPGFSVEQYERSSASFHDWVRSRLSLTGQRDVVRDYREIIKSLCNSIRNRQDAVNKAIAANVSRKDHPAALPDNIYGTTGEWETYSTPSRDARLKAAVRELHRFVSDSYTAVRDGDSTRYSYDGSSDELAQYFRDTWDELSTGECRITYRTSSSRDVALTLDDFVTRLFDLSFDPYHCPELRWGAHPDKLPGELASCPDGPDKIKWYRDEYRLRNRIDRDYDSITTLDFGPEQHEDIDVPKLLRNLESI